MTLVLTVVHIVICLTLILIVLLQTGKGADMGAAFGGGSSQTLFGSTGASTFLSKATTTVAVIFMLTSLMLAYVSGDRTGSSLMLDNSPPAQSSPAETDDGAAAPAADEAARAGETSEPESTQAAPETSGAETAPAESETN
jgi:preprotein translocase subunit SecG